MKLKPRVIKLINLLLYSATLLATFSFSWTLLLYQVVSTALTPFDQFIIPGYLFYLKYKEKWLREDVDISLYILSQRLHS